MIAQGPAREMPRPAAVTRAGFRPARNAGKTIGDIS